MNNVTVYDFINFHIFKKSDFDDFPGIPFNASHFLLS